MGKYNANGSICKMKGGGSDYQHFQYRSYPSHPNTIYSLYTGKLLPDCPLL